jgi:hypothetical protein
VIDLAAPTPPTLSPTSFSRVGGGTRPAASKPSTTTRAIGSERCARGRPRSRSSNHGPLMPLRKFQIAAKRVHVKGEAQVNECKGPEDISRRR